MLAKAMRRAVERPMLVLTPILALQTLPTLWAKEVWFPDEPRHAAAFMQMMENGHWLVLHVGQIPYPDKPPLYFWMLAGLSWLFDSRDPALFQFAAALSALFFLTATVHAARAFCLPRSVPLLAGLVLLTDHFFIERAHFPRMDLLFCTFILLSHVFFYRAATGPRDLTPRAAMLAFAMAGLATLTKGPIGILLPLAGLVLFLARERRLAALLDRGYGAGLAVYAAMMATYLAGVVAVEGLGFLHAILVEQTLARALDTWIAAEPFYFYLRRLPEFWLPWTVLLFFLPWRRLGESAFWRTLWGAPQKSGEHKGRAYLWITALGSLAIISSFDYKVRFLVLTFYPQTAMLIALFLAELPRSRRVAVFSVVLGFLAVLVTALPALPQALPWPERIKGEWMIFATGLVALALLVMLRRRPPIIFVGSLATGLALVFLPYYLLTIRGLNDTMSPRVQGEIMGRHADAGYALYYYDPPFSEGMFDYYAGRAVPNIWGTKALAAAVAGKSCGVVAMRDRYWRSWDNRPEGMELIDERILDRRTIMLLRWRRGADGEKPCTVPAAAS
ncbi:glycosyltransferase family 39 protein [Nitratireductor arenosus]|uniref:glycosyltransferase family 39 protein n=1 Tax=Nitratireductor arenosus TaxID=2682096 RepID=UPI0018D248E9